MFDEQKEFLVLLYDALDFVMNEILSDSISRFIFVILFLL